MRNRFLTEYLYAACLLTYLSSGSALAQVNRYVEDFTTRQYCNTLLTTADWDTVNTSLHCPTFRMSVVGGWDSPGSAWQADIDGDHLFLADDASGLQILDVTDPAVPTLLGGYNTAGTAYDVDVEGNIAYVADGAAGLRAVDISNPSVPVALGVYNTPGTAFAVEVRGDLAYVADGSGGLRVINVQNPSMLTYVGTVATAGSAYGLDVKGNHAFVAAYDAGLVTVDISNPSTPVVVSSFNTPGFSSGVVVQGDLAYLADGVSGLAIIDVTDPESPDIVFEMDTPDRAYAVAVDGNWAYVADLNGGVHVISIADPKHPLLFQTGNPPSNARGVVLAGTHAYVADYTNGLQVLEIAQYTPPGGTIGTLATDFVQFLVIDGDIAYATGGGLGFAILDVSDPEAPALISTLPTPGWTQECRVDGNHAYLAAGAGGLLVVDVKDVFSPTVVGQCAVSGTANHIVVSGDYAYITDGFDLNVIDIVNPANPQLAASYAAPLAGGVCIAGNQAFLGRSGDGLEVVDITNPYSPVFSGLINLGWASEVAVDGDYAFTNGSGLKVFDISDPTNPILEGQLAYDYSGRIVLHGNELFTENAYSGCRVIDISTPDSPSQLGVFATSNAVSLGVSGDHLFIGDGDDGLLVFKAYHRALYPGEFAQSLIVNEPIGDIAKVRVTADLSGPVELEFSVDAGDTWDLATGDGTWVSPTAPGSALVWRSTHQSPDGYINPTCDTLEMDWLHTFPFIDAIEDFPDDQGGRVRIVLDRSAYDFSDETAQPIMMYNVWRRIGGGVAAQSLEAANADAGATGGVSMLNLYAGARIYADPVFQAAGFPEGTWEVLGSFAATQQDQYIYPAATLADSSVTIPYAVYMVTAHTTTPSLWFASLPDSGYSVDNIAPAVPGGFVMGGGALLSWNASPEPDFQYYTVYGSATGSVTKKAVLIDNTIGISMDVSMHAYDFYFLTASDNVGNESPPAIVSGLSAVPGREPSRYVLHECVPNPFNPHTTISFDLTRPTKVDLRIYDVSGHLVKTLINGQIMEAGRRSVTWRGRDEFGRGVSAGLYFYRLEAGSFSDTKRMTLVK